METKELLNENLQENAVAEEKKPKKKSGVKAIVLSFLIVVLFLGIQVVGGLIGNVIFSVQLVAKEGQEALTQEYLLQQITESGFMTNLLCLVTILIAVIAVLWYYFGYAKKNAVDDSLPKPEWRNAKGIISLILVAFACYSFDALLCQLMAAISPSAVDSFANLMGTALSGSAWVALLTTVIIAPIGEEALFRGVIFRKIARDNKIAVAVIAQAVLFGIYHANLVQGIYAFAIGAVLGYIAYRFKSILPCIFVHAVNNFAPSFVGMLPEKVTNNGVVFSLILVVVFVICAVAVYAMNKDFFRKEK